MNKDPVRIGGTLGALAHGWGMEYPIETARIFAGWAQIVGPEVAARCKPTSLKGGVLKVRTESAVWANEFRFLAAEVVARINADLGKPVIREVKPWVKAAVGENRAMPPHPTRSQPATTRGTAEMAKQAAEVARSIEDPQLSEALRKALLAAKISQNAVPGVVHLKGSRRAEDSSSRPQSNPPRRHP